MVNYDSEQKELATRDKVSVSIYKEILAGRGAAHGGIYATVAHLDPDYIVRQLPIIFKKYIDFGYDVRKGPIEVKPRPHYVNGGVVINTTAETKVPRLFAAGAITAGVHGANRLGSNALVDILVFGEIAGKNAASKKRKNALSDKGIVQQVKDEIKRISNLFSESGKKKPVTVPPLRRKHLEMMDAHIGVIRSEEGIKTMLKEIERAKSEDLPKYADTDSPWH